MSNKSDDLEKLNISSKSSNSSKSSKSSNYSKSSKSSKSRKNKNTVKKRKTSKIFRDILPSNETHDICSICLEPLEPLNKPVVTLICNHKFHRNCMNDACNKRLAKTIPCKCPYCRTDVDEANLKPPPKYTDPKKFGNYINSKLNDHTNTPLEKLEDALSSFLGTDSLPKKLLEHVAIEFILSKRLNADVDEKDWLGRYRFERILELDSERLPPKDKRGNTKYFQFISNPEQDKNIAYQVRQV
jgi:hypothetical protein